MRYISTRGEAASLDFEGVLLTGLARDGGLYVPESWPTLTPEAIADMAGLPFAELATRVILPFTGDTFTRAELRTMAEAAYRSFDHPAVTPLVQIAPDTFVLELFHGPTLAFKDVAMQLLARMMDHVLARQGRRAVIVGATSGDTGGAAIEAFRGSSRVDVVILFPAGRVSDVQRRMMTTPTEANVHALAIEGTFDDCQALVKAMFNHLAFRDRVGLSGINSINWGRIVAQITYYFAAASALGAPHRPVSFAVPTGNFGDILAGYAAKRMGLGIDKLTIGANDNDILPRTLATGAYEMREVRATTSPSMDIQISSNFERYLFEASNRDAGLIRRQMESLKQSRAFTLTTEQVSRLVTDFAGQRRTEAEVAETIAATLAATGYLIEPHTACAMPPRDRAGQRVPEVVLATAHPAKFPDAMAAITGVRPPLPPRLEGLMSAPERFEVLGNDQAAVERFVEQRVRAGTAS